MLLNLITARESQTMWANISNLELSCIDASRSRLYPDFKEGIKGLEKATSYTKREQPNKDSKGHLDPKVFSSYPKLPFAIMTSKAVGNSCHFRPRIIQRIEAPTSLQQQQQHNHCPYFPVPRGKGILINKKSPASSSDIIRVPRDNKTPFFIYTPPKYTLKPLPVKQPEAYNESLKLSPPSLKPISEVHSFACTRVSDTKPQESPVNTLADSSQDVTSTSERRKSTEQSTTKALSQWSVDEVYAYFQKTECATYATIFKDQVRWTAPLEKNKVYRNDYWARHTFFLGNWWQCASTFRRTAYLNTAWSKNGSSNQTICYNQMHETKRVVLNTLKLKLYIKILVYL